MVDALILAALSDEYISQDILDCPITYTGVGKINATRTTTEQILKYKPELVLNVGTAGSLKPEMSGVFVVKDVIEHDMLAEPLAPRGTTPFDRSDSILQSDRGSVRCATGDSFVTEKDPWLILNRVDLVDMELFAIAKVCEFYGVKWRSMKYVSDHVDEQSANSWRDSLEHSSTEIRKAIERLLD
jgi:adenosylhomocysteine nucleosidase